MARENSGRIGFEIRTEWLEKINLETILVSSFVKISLCLTEIIVLSKLRFLMNSLYINMCTNIINVIVYSHFLSYWKEVILKGKLILFVF